MALCVVLGAASLSAAEPAQAEAAAAAAPAPLPEAQAQPAPAPQSAPLEPDRPSWAEPVDGESMGVAFAKMLLVLALVLAIVYVTLNYGLRRLLNVPMSRANLVKVHERVALEPKKSVCVVEVAGEYLLLGVGEREVNFLARLDGPKVQEGLTRKPAPRSPSKPFFERLLVKPPRKTGGDPTP